MAAMPELQSATSRAIDAFCATLNDGRDDDYLRCSAFGYECDRFLWYRLRWAYPTETFPPRIVRVFGNGHDREGRIIGYLRGAGIKVSGTQYRVSLAGGALRGSCDGIAENVPEATATRHLLEIKTMNAKRYAEWRRKGVKVSDPKYYVQAQLYMHGLKLSRCLFVVESQDTKEIESERFNYDAELALRMEARAERIASTSVPPARLSDDPEWYQCRFCPAHAICHGGGMARMNCRTCVFSGTDGHGWQCSDHKETLTRTKQEDGCADHLFIPHLVPFEQIDADEAARTVTYRKPDGSLFVDGGKLV